MTFEGVWNNISDRFPSLILLSGVRNLYHDLVLVASENSRCSATYNSGPKRWGCKESAQRTHFSPIRAKGPWLTSLLTRQQPYGAKWKPALLVSILPGTPNDALQAPQVWALMMRQARGELAVSWAAGWKGGGQLKQIALPDSLSHVIGGRQEDGKINLNHSLQWRIRIKASRSHCKESHVLQWDFEIYTVQHVIF